MRFLRKLLDSYSPGHLGLDGIAALPPLITRILAGYVFYLTGRKKLGDLDAFIAYFDHLGIPFPDIQAPFVGGLEFAGSIALLLGVATRLFALLLSITMVVALITAHREQFIQAWSPTSKIDPTQITALVLLALLAWLVVHGAGRLGMDGLAAWWLRRREEEGTPDPPKAPLPSG